MNQGQTRIACPRCRANNFPGQTNCFQCGGSLPPPDAFGHSGHPPVAQAPPQPHFPPQYAAQTPAYPPYYPPGYPVVRARRPSWALPVFILFAIFLLGGATLMFLRRGGVQSPRGVSSDLASEAARLDQIRKQYGLGAQQDDRPSSDTSEAQDALQKARAKYGLDGGGGTGGGTGNSGGAISFGDWQRSHPDTTNYQFR